MYFLEHTEFREALYDKTQPTQTLALWTELEKIHEKALRIVGERDELLASC